MKMNEYVDVLIPRGGKGLIKAVVNNSTIPVIETGTGNCHIYVDESADLQMAADIVMNAKTQRVGVCNACESLLVHEKVKDAFLPVLAERLRTKNVEMRADEEAKALIPDAVTATEEDWGDDYPKTFSVNLIWGEARDKEGRAGAIGLNGGMPWHCAEDMKHLKELTVSHPVIMGRKTWESLGGKYRPLPNRDNIVVSRDPMYRAPGATVVTSLDDALDMARQEAIPDDGLDRSEIWIIGGAQLFAEAGSRSGRVAYARQGGVRHRFLSFPYLGQNQVSMRIRLMPFIAA